MYNKGKGLGLRSSEAISRTSSLEPLKGSAKGLRPSVAWGS